MYIARTPYAHGPGETPSGIALRLAQQFITRLDDQRMALSPNYSTDPAERAARALRMAQLHARTALWWAIVIRYSHYGSVPFVYVNAAIVARAKAEEDSRFWRETAADWTARALGRPTSDCAGAMSNWDELGITDLGRAHLAAPTATVGTAR